MTALHCGAGYGRNFFEQYFKVDNLSQRLSRSRQVVTGVSHCLRLKPLLLWFFAKDVLFFFSGAVYRVLWRW